MAAHKQGTYFSWYDMVRRCTKPSCKDYSSYGAKGITVCERWLTFANFFADMGDKPEGKTLDRKDNAKGYAKENCRWATPKEQVANSRHPKVITINGVSRHVLGWANHLGITNGALYHSAKKRRTTLYEEIRRRLGS